MLKLVKNNLKYLLYCILCCVFLIKTAFADDINIPKQTYQLLYAYSGKIDTNNSKSDNNINDSVENKNDDKKMFSFVNDAGDVAERRKNKNTDTNAYKDKFTFAGIGFGTAGLGVHSKDTFIFVGIGLGTSGFGVNAGCNDKIFGIRFSAQTLKINSPFIINDELSLKLFNGWDYGVDFMLRPTSYMHIDIGVHYFKNIVSVHYNNTNLFNNTALSDYNLTVGGDVDVEIGNKIVPYFGFGFNIRLFAQLYLDIDLGVMLTGDYKIKSYQVYLEDDAKNHVTADVNPSFKDIEYTTGYKADKHNYKVWPIAKIGFSYRYNL